MNCFLIILFSIFQLLIRSTACYDTIGTDEYSSITNNIYFLYYTGTTVDDYTKIPYKDGLSIEEEKGFDPEKGSVFYFHGYTEKPSEHIESVDTIVKALLTRDLNIVVLDYSELVKDGVINSYLSAAANVTKIGEVIGNFFKHYIPTVQTINKIHLVGHSLGSQVLSNCAKKYGEGQFKWLTGLDPAGPLFNNPLVQHLSKKDGQFVDIIHTDAFYYGDGRSLGHVDFFPNIGVRKQPFCVIDDYSDFCSHHMSWRYYAESIEHPDNFPAKMCHNMNIYCHKVNMNLCCDENASVAFMGYGVNHSSRGNYYLKTAAKSPFRLGDAGFYV